MGKWYCCLIPDEDQGVAGVVGWEITGVGSLSQWTPGEEWPRGWPKTCPMLVMERAH